MLIMEYMFVAVLSLFATCVVIFFKTLYKEKAKNRALIEDAGRIEEEKQRVIHEYTLETERVKQAHAKEIEGLKQQSAERLDKQKRDHEIDVQKRKYKYESKSREYHRFMDEIDAFRGLNIEIIEKELSPMISACFASDLGVSSQLFVDANNKATSIIGSVRAQEAKLFAQINGVKLNASQEILDLLDELRTNISQSKLYLEKVVEYVFSENFRHTKRIPAEVSNHALGLNERTVDLNKKLLAALKADLDTL
ncbi:hypothetical protein [Pseudomonas monteilii]|uniref:hypothetical protein n=1 Tax=Pseudomonas monteilii TaxID=76759 RepID=UPI0018AA4710|nr:hypothetical protein [Pseudomonas monteilii]MBF8748237.1 hypothetical protein [Pseudomonas monteilii]